jgi:hypothetical protein
MAAGRGVGANSALLWMLLVVTSGAAVLSSSLADRGDEGRRRESLLFHRYGGDRSSCSAVMHALLAAGLLLLRTFLLRLSPPARGRCGEFDGGLFFFIAVGEATSYAFSIQQCWSWKPLL